MRVKFISNDRNDISVINEYLSENYSCVRDGKCSGSYYFEKGIQKECGHILEIQCIDTNSFLLLLELLITDMFDQYNNGHDDLIEYSRLEDLTSSVFMKSVDIATNLLLASMMCNYYTSTFATYNSQQDTIGYEVYDPLEYGEDVSIVSPIPTHNYAVERMGETVINNIEYKETKDDAWAIDASLTRNNVVMLMKDIEYQNNKWVLLAGRFSLHEDECNTTIWKDTYDFYCCINQSETICADGNARYLTIELDAYDGRIPDYHLCKDRPWLCKGIKPIEYASDYLDETSMVLPPAGLIDFFELTFNSKTCSWTNEHGEIIIYCNNNKSSYYKDPACGTIFMRKDYYEKYTAEHPMKYFGFAERYLADKGYSPITSLHFELCDGVITKEISNDDHSEYKEIFNPVCDNCAHPTFARNLNEKQEIPERIKRILDEYGEVYE